MTGVRARLETRTSDKKNRHRIRLWGGATANYHLRYFQKAKKESMATADSPMIR